MINHKKFNEKNCKKYYRCHEKDWNVQFKTRIFFREILFRLTIFERRPMKKRKSQYLSLEFEANNRKRKPEVFEMRHLFLGWLVQKNHTVILHYKKARIKTMWYVMALTLAYKTFQMVELSKLAISLPRWQNCNFT